MDFRGILSLLVILHHTADAEIGLLRSWQSTCFLPIVSRLLFFLTRYSSYVSFLDIEKG